MRLRVAAQANSRVFLVPQTEGAQWELGAVGNAEWTGVPLAALLHHAVMEDALEIVREGADRETPKEKPIPHGTGLCDSTIRRYRFLERNNPAEMPRCSIDIVLHFFLFQGLCTCEAA
jgi:Oxidoreductase molybdopterin binding domain